MTAATIPTPAGTVRTPALPSALRLGLARTRQELRVFARERDAVFFIFLYPILMLAIFATVFGTQDPFSGTGVDVTFAQYFPPGMIATGVILSSFQSLAIFIAVERDEGLLKRLRGRPLPASSYFLGTVGQVLVVRGRHRRPPRDQLVAGVRAAARGESALSPSVARRLVQQLRSDVDRPTARELEVLPGVARGLSNAAIGRELLITEATVKTHLLPVFGKLGVDDRAPSPWRSSGASCPARSPASRPSALAHTPLPLPPRLRRAREMGTCT